MKTSRLVILVLVSLLALLPPVLSSPRPAVAGMDSPATKIALTGDSLPPPFPQFPPVQSVIADVGPPDVNDGGAVVFYVQSSFGPPCAVVKDSGGSLTVMALEGDTSPLGTIILCPYLATSPIADGTGRVAFAAMTPGGPAILVATGPRTYSDVVVAGQAVPTGGTYGVPTLKDFNDNGLVLFQAPVTGATYPEALFVGSGGGAATRVVAVGDSTPAGGTYTSPLGGGGGGGGAAMNNSGKVVFQAGVSGALAATAGVFLKSGGTTKTVTVVDPPESGTTQCGNDVTDDADTWVNEGCPAVGYPESVAAGECGTDNQDDDGDTKVNDGCPTQGAWVGDPTYGSDFTSLAKPMINDSDQVAFYADSGTNYGGGYFIQDTSASQPTNTKLVLKKDPSAVGDEFTANATDCPGITDGLISGDPHGLRHDGTLVVVGCGGDPMSGGFVMPYGHKLVISGQLLPGSATETFEKLSAAAASENNYVAFKTSTSTGRSGIFQGGVSVVITDSDGDGLLDSWEQSGMDENNDGTIDLNLAALGASKNQKDIFVEVDYEDCAIAGSNCGVNHSHKPIGGIIEDGATGVDSCNDHIDNGNDGKCDTGVGCTGGDAGKPADPDCSVVKAFADAPVNIKLHVIVDEAVVHENLTDFKAQQPAPCPQGNPPNGLFEAYKCTKFTTAADRAPNTNAKWIKAAKRKVFHYALYTHQQPGAFNCSSGKAEIWGNDFYVSLGGLRAAATPCWTVDGTGESVGSAAEQEGTFMHELGHNLGLRHGGADDLNYKPNYLSVMNYTFQMPYIVPRGTWGVNNSGSFLDYSRWRLTPAAAGVCVGNPVGWLNEAALNETCGVDNSNAPVAPAGFLFWKTAHTYPRDLNGDTTVDDCPFVKRWVSGSIDWDANRQIQNPVKTGINDPAAVGESHVWCVKENDQALSGFDDWANIKYRFTDAAAYADGTPHGPLPPDEGRPQPDSDGDTIADISDNCSTIPNVDQIDTDGDTRGDPCDPVGGIAELPDVSGSSGANYALLAGLVAAGVAAVLTITGGAWYARRRWFG